MGQLNRLSFAVIIISGAVLIIGNFGEDPDIPRRDRGPFGEDPVEVDGSHRLERIYRRFRFFYERLLREKLEKDEEISGGFTKNIIDAPSNPKCPPGQRPDGHGRCRVPL
uniref:SPP3B protein n=1 Tax=Fopius arisanus TaxID=64838 RepID=A0A0C9QIH9_9HYME